MKRLFLITLAAILVSLPLAAQKPQKRDIKVVESELLQARDSLAKALEECRLLSRQMSGVDTLRRLAVRSMLRDYSGYPGLPFSQMDPIVVDSLRYIGDCLSAPELETLMAGLDSAVLHRTVFLDGRAVLEKDYDKAGLDSARQEISGVKPLCSPSQQAELDELVAGIDLYPEALEQAFLVADWIADTLKNLREAADPATKDNAANQANYIFKDQEEGYQNSVSKIPYLDRLYTAFRKAVSENPLEVGPEEVQILGYGQLF